VETSLGAEPGLLAKQVVRQKLLQKAPLAITSSVIVP
jgi:hypothetical protein